MSGFDRLSPPPERRDAVAERIETALDPDAAGCAEKALSDPPVTDFERAAASDTAPIPASERPDFTAKFGSNPDTRAREYRVEKVPRTVAAPPAEVLERPGVAEIASAHKAAVASDPVPASAGYTAGGFGQPRVARETVSIGRSAEEWRDAALRRIEDIDAIESEYWAKLRDRYGAGAFPEAYQSAFAAQFDSAIQDLINAELILRQESRPKES